MKRRVRKIANFFAFNLLFFALYLNFIHKDQAPAVSGSVSAQESPASYSKSEVSKTEAQVVADQSSGSVTAANTAPLKLSIN
ncbi:MAG TPA: hypothetical protein PKA77_03020 [Chitinophagaceae bacterium]|jgi:hypothetical protein|nr:hypothetical protein [Chitinophagaceae bacterium]HMU56852.1 hypothetical protein [Chitinophagaceae bacterium]